MLRPGDGQGRDLHLGRAPGDTGLDFVALDLTDDGAALVTVDGAVWFADGTGVERVGTTSGATATKDDGVSPAGGQAQEWFAVGTSVVPRRPGSRSRQRSTRTTSWAELNSRERRVVTMEPVPVERRRDTPLVVGLVGREVFVLRDPQRATGRCPEHVAQVRGRRRCLRRGRPRVLRVGDPRGAAGTGAGADG